MHELQGVVAEVLDHYENQWHPWVEEQGGIWVDKDGGIHLVEHLPLPYAVNILRFLAREHTSAIAKPIGKAIMERVVSGDGFSRG